MEQPLIVDQFPSFTLQPTGHTDLPAIIRCQRCDTIWTPETPQEVLEFTRDHTTGQCRQVRHDRIVAMAGRVLRAAS